MHNHKNIQDEINRGTVFQFLNYNAPFWNFLAYYYYNKPYLYSIKPLKRSLSKYIDFKKLNNIANGPRLIITSTDMQKSQSVTFDSKFTSIDTDHIVACAGFPFYGIAWTEKDGKYLWDGALQSNTPLREIIDASPKHDKIVYIINLFPHIQKEIPQTMLGSWHRARDIMHTDKTDQNIRMSKVISRYLTLLRQMHDIISNVQLDEKMKESFRKIEKEYHRLANERGAIIKKITRIERAEDVPFLFEDADFSISTIKKSIKQGENDAENALATN